MLFTAGGRRKFMDINRLFYDFGDLLTRRTNPLTEDSVRYCLFSCMLRQDSLVDHYTMEMLYDLMTQTSKSSIIASTGMLKKSRGTFRQELDLLYDDGISDIICIEIKFHRHADILQEKKQSDYAHTNAAGSIINDMRRLAVINSAGQRTVRRLFVYVTDDEMHNYLSYKSKEKKNEAYRIGLSSFYIKGGQFDCNNGNATPKTFIDSANSSFFRDTKATSFCVMATKRLFIEARQLNCPSFQNGNCYISLFDVLANADGLLGFITSDGEKHLGFYTPQVNPCGNHSDSNVYKRIYTDVHGIEYDNVTGKCSISEVSCFYWDEIENDYKPLPIITPHRKISYAEKALESMKGLFAKDLITSSPLPAMAARIQEWLFLNAQCEAPVYVDKIGKIHSDGKIEFNADIAQNVPAFINIANE